VSDARRLKALEAENAKLKKRLAEQMLDVATLKEMLEKTSEARFEETCRELGYEGEELFAAAGLCLDRMRRDNVDRTGSCTAYSDVLRAAHPLLRGRLAGRNGWRG
jgi:hypothetical protein